MRCVLLAILGLAVMVLASSFVLDEQKRRLAPAVSQPSLSLKLEIIEQDLAESVLKVRATENWNSQAPIEFRTPEDLALHNVDDDHPPPFLRTIELRVNGKRRSGYRGNDCFSRPQAPGYYVSGGAEAALQFRQAKPYYRKLRLDKPYECNLASVLREPADYEICLFASWYSTLAEVNRAKGLPANHPPTDLELEHACEIEDPVTGERTLLYPGPPIASNWLKVKVTDPMPPIPRIDFDKWLAERKAEAEAERKLAEQKRQLQKPDADALKNVPNPALALKLEVIAENLAERVLKVRTTANWNSQAPIELHTPGDLTLYDGGDGRTPFWRTLGLRLDGNFLSAGWCKRHRGNFDLPGYSGQQAKPNALFDRAKPYYRKLMLDKPYECNLAHLLYSYGDYEICLFASWHSTLAEVNKAKGLPETDPPTELEMQYSREFVDPKTGAKLTLYPGPPIPSNKIKVKSNGQLPERKPIDFDKWLAERNAEVEAEKNLKPTNR